MDGPSERYAALYSLQDRVMEILYREQMGFYLTGGTALNRFYLHHRYSDDLDFFSHEINAFFDACRLFHVRILEVWPETNIEVDSRDFKRLLINDGTVSLKIDLIADRVPRIGKPVIIDGCYIDTVRNILSNKLCAVLGRDEGRDIADILEIARKRNFNWREILIEAKSKEVFTNEELLYRLSTFPVHLLDLVPYIEGFKPMDAEQALGMIQADIACVGPNTLASPGSENL